MSLFSFETKRSSSGFRGRSALPGILLLAGMLFLGAGLSSVAADTQELGPAAVVGGKVVSWADVESAVGGQLQALERQRHQLLESGLGAAVEKRLVELEAARLKTSPESLLTAEVESHVAAVTPEEVDLWYEQNRARLGNRPKEGLAPQITDFLRQQRLDERRQVWMAGLEKRFGVERHLEPWRVELPLGDAPVRGPADAQASVVIFSDFQCPFCSRILPTLEKVHETYGDKVSLAFRNLPLESIHPQAKKAAEAALCAKDQGKFWPMHDAIFARQKELAPEQLKARAAELELDPDSFSACLDGGRKAAAVEADLRQAGELGISSTPSIFVNGRPVALGGNREPFVALSALIDEEIGTR